MVLNLDGYPSQVGIVGLRDKAQLILRARMMLIIEALGMVIIQEAEFLRARTFTSRIYVVCELLAVAVVLAGCGSENQSKKPTSNTPHIAKLETYGPLYTVMVDVAGAPRRFLVDTGGGMTVFSPELAKESGYVLGGPLAGFRMSGEKIVAPRCEGARVSIGGWESQPHTVWILDINKLLPPDWPRVDGLLSLATFDDHVVTVDLPGRRLVIDDAVPTHARSVRTHFERSMMGLALIPYFASRHGDKDIWFEVDTGSVSGAILNEPLAPIVGLASKKPSPGAKVDLRLDSGEAIQTPVETRKLIIDGNIGLGTMRSWVLTFDLAEERAWISILPK